MAYGTVKVDNITFTNDGIDQTVTVSGIVQSISGSITVTGTIQGATIIGTSTVSGATVTGDAGVFTAVTGDTGSFATLSGGVATITSGVFALGAENLPSISFSSDPDTGIYSPGADQVAISTSGTGRLFINASGQTFLNQTSQLSSHTSPSFELTGDTVINSASFGTGNESSLYFYHRRLNDTATRPGSSIHSITEDSYTPGNAGTFDSALVLRTVLNNVAGDRARIDSSGRLLVGTSTSSAVATQVLQGNSSATTGNSRLILANGTTTPSTLGDIVFSDSGHTDSAFIRGAKDSGTWTTGVSQPSLLGFYTTPDTTATPVAGLFIRANGKLESDTTYLATTANAANLHIDSGGYFLRSTSSAKYKTDVETLQDSYSDAILGIRPVWYRSICENDKPTHSWWGFIAEEVAAIDPRLVQWKTVDVSYDENGAPVQKPCDPEPDGVAYERFVPHLLNLIKRQKEQIEAMESRLTALEQS